MGGEDTDKSLGSLHEMINNILPGQNLLREGRPFPLI